MAKDIKVLRKKIKSFNSTLHLTGAMGLVASSKIRKANEAMMQNRKYLKSLDNVITELLQNVECKRSVFVDNNVSDKKSSNFNNDSKVTSDNSDNKVRLIVIAGDRGLCGGYNANIFRFVNQFEQSEVIPIGKRVFDRFSDNNEIDEDTDEEVQYDSSEFYSYESAFKLANECINDYKEGKITKLGIVYSKYVSIISQTPEIRWVLPFSNDAGDKTETTKQGSYCGTVFEPNAFSLFEEILPTYLAGVIFALIKESFACEVSARRMAMDSAKKNANEMIDNLNLEYNRVRQGKITQEITEIVAGSGR